MDNKEKRSISKKGTQTHQPTVTRADLYDKGELILKDSQESDQHFRVLEKTLKKIKKQMKQRKKEITP